ncbi:hypothetical protein B0H13DRAFT_2032300 [Mycena leptocephala]|nr:hypothetical protein B0H13DRAFT_2032300 [Mycena leptocephala]
MMCAVYNICSRCSPSPTEPSLPNPNASVLPIVPARTIVLVAIPIDTHSLAYGLHSENRHPAPTASIRLPKPGRRPYTRLPDVREPSLVTHFDVEAPTLPPIPRQARPLRVVVRRPRRHVARSQCGGDLARGRAAAGMGERRRGAGRGCCGGEGGLQVFQWVGELAFVFP